MSYRRRQFFRRKMPLGAVGTIRDLIFEAIFQEPCDPEKVRRQDLVEKRGIGTGAMLNKYGRVVETERLEFKEGKNRKI